MTCKCGSGFPAVISVGEGETREWVCVECGPREAIDDLRRQHGMLRIPVKMTAEEINAIRSDFERNAYVVQADVDWVVIDDDLGAMFAWSAFLSLLQTIAFALWSARRLDPRAGVIDGPVVTRAMREMFFIDARKDWT